MEGQLRISGVRRRQTHEMAPSKLPGRNAKPWPISARKRSPSTSRSRATSAKKERVSGAQLEGHRLV